jgi:hypothetical protein
VQDHESLPMWSFRDLEINTKGGGAYYNKDSLHYIIRNKLIGMDILLFHFF